MGRKKKEAKPKFEKYEVVTREEDPALYRRLDALVDRYHKSALEPAHIALAWAHDVKPDKDGRHQLWQAATGQAMVAFSVNSATSHAKRDHALPIEQARTVDTRGGYAPGQGGTLIAGTLVANPKQGVQLEQTFVPADRTVRRLTPLECERLQGLPDAWTCLCGVTPYTTPTCRCKDGPRYRVLGNGGAVPNVVWIAGRMLAAGRVA